MSIPDLIPVPGRFPPEFTLRFFLPEILAFEFLLANGFMAYHNAAEGMGNLYIGISVIGMVYCIACLWRWLRSDWRLYRLWCQHKAAIIEYNHTVQQLKDRNLL